MAMAYQPKGFAVVPLSLGMSLAAEADSVKRCRSCAAYSDPTAPHSECVILSISEGRLVRKAGYAGVRKQRVPRGQALPQQGQRLCKGCGADISSRSSYAIYCGTCRGRRTASGATYVQTAAKSRYPEGPRLCAICGCDISHRRPHALYCAPCYEARPHRAAGDVTPHRKGACVA